MESFRCVLTNWDYIYNLCRKISREIKGSGYEPDVIIALARGGWFAGRVLCDFLGLDDLTSLKIEHYVGAEAIDTGEPHIRYPLSKKAVEGKNVLLVDDMVDTGESLLSAKTYIRTLSPAKLKTASLQYLSCSKIEPEYIGERLEEWVWIVYPWNFIEDLTSLLKKAMKADSSEEWELEALKALLLTRHSLHPISFEIAQPGRLLEVLEEMERTGKVSSELKEGKRYWKLREGKKPKK
ncbi:MAG: phosphoribosyltransferase [Methanosarcinaceae archaeon]|nr:phosphoribosyltransferase [Methanosarcinaceae archaeon]MDD4332221.1 phosphoribosyltransferase [Methanosarcinaceae archaeon]MDD4749209.1 phosphoribosyltransferase [Methanosarcinaceae archaeon]